MIPLASGGADFQQLQRAGEEVRGSDVSGEQPEPADDASGKKVSDQHRHQTPAGERLHQYITVYCTSYNTVIISSICTYITHHWSQTDFLLQETESSVVDRSQSSIVQKESSEPKHEGRNIQRDQSAPLRQRETLQEVHGLLSTETHLPTAAPFISFPVTKTPGS